MSHKRAAEDQLTRDDDGEDRADAEFVTTPQIADEAEMATRRVVKVRRPPAESSATPSSGSTSGFFKDAATSAGSTAPTKPGFSCGFGASAGSAAVKANTFSFGTAAAAAADSAKPSFGFPTTTSSTAPSTFSFGTASAATTTTTSSSSPSATTFSFGSTAPASGDAAKKPVEGFKFGLPTTTTTTTASKTSADDGESAKAPAPADEKKPVFGAGGFNFSNAVNSFVAARTKMQEDAKDAKEDGTAAKAAEKDSHNDEDEDKPDPAGFGSEIVEPTARNVLATAPSKLYLFENGEDGKVGRWVERGTGDAKLISQPSPDDEKEHVYRLLVRGGYSLNATIKKNTFTLSKTESKHLILLVATAEGPHTYLLKFTGPSAEANTSKFSEELKKVVEEVSKAE